MNALFIAIYNQFTKDLGGGVHYDVYDDVSGRFYLEHAPQDVDWPYIVYNLVNDANDWTFSENYEDCAIQFNLFSEAASADEVGDMFTHLKTCFDDCALTVAAYTHLYMQRGELASLRWDPDAKHWHYVIEYNILIQN